MGGQNNESMSLITVEAYAMPSSTYVENDSHCFVITEDKKTCWRNKGGGWEDSRPKTKVAVNSAYKEWMWEFVPPTDIDRCGINFGENGVCHTFANRELLIGESAADASNAAKDYVCVFFFGKYGMGIKKLKQLLTDSYNRTVSSYHDPYNALNKVLARVDNTVDDELQAWRLVGIEYANIPIDEILAKDPYGGLITARSRLESLIEKREKIYQDFVDSGRAGGTEKLYRNVRDLIEGDADDYLDMLASIHYITQSDRQIYAENISKFLNSMMRCLIAQNEEFQRTGRIADDFSTLTNLNWEE